MKKVMLFMLAMMSMIVVTSCGSDDDGPEISFQRTTYSLTDGTLPVTLVVSGVDNATYPVTFGGTAVKGQDYTVDAEQYVVGGTNQVLTINVTAKNNFTEAKTITMTAGGATTTINLGVRARMLYSFEQKAYVMGQSVEIEFQLQNASTGEYYTAPSDIEITLQPKSTSTAIEGTHYEFANKTATIHSGSHRCSFTLNRLAYEEGKDSIVLVPQVTEADGFVAGSYPETSVKMISGVASDLIGQWQMYRLDSDPTFFNEQWYGMIPESDFTNFPTLNTADTYTFANEGSDGEPTLTVNLQSGFKNYFIGASHFTIGGEMSYHETMSFGVEPVTLQLLNLDNVNRYFSASQTSESKSAKIGVRNVVEDGETYLKVYIIDYEPTDFLSTIKDYFSPEYPDGGAIMFTLKKVK